jgi:hypothetical protein
MQVILLLYSVLLSFWSKKCFRHLDVFLTAPSSLGMGIAFVQMLLLSALTVSKILARIRKQSVGLSNRTKLALCSSGLCAAQKRRMRNVNAWIDFITLIWLVLVLCMENVYLQTYNGSQYEHGTDYVNKTLLNVSAKNKPSSTGNNSTCRYEQDYVEGYSGVTTCIICELVPLVAAVACWLGISVGIMLKTVALATDFDFSVQSQEMEKLLFPGNDSQIIQYFVKWVHLVEWRQSISVQVAVVFFWVVLLFALGGYTVLPNESQSLIAPAVYIVSVLTLLMDGGILFLPVSLFRMCFGEMTRKNVKRWWFEESLRCQNPTGLKSVPQRRAVFALLWMIFIPFLGGCQLANMGALNSINLFAALLLVICLVLLVPMLVVTDMKISMHDLIRLSAEDNFGLVLSRKHLGSELDRALQVAAGAASPGSEIEIFVPTFLASQERIELAVVISYRWSDERLYTHKSAEGAAADVPLCLRLRNSGCSGCDWIVTIVEPQARELVRHLSRACEDYVWMDQFSVPQACVNSGTRDYETDKEQVRNVLIPRMTGLYSSAGRVLAFNNSGDARLLDKDWYQNRLWCLQEYCFPASLQVVGLSGRSACQNAVVQARREVMARRWFGETYDIRVGQVADAGWGGGPGGLAILLDWTLSPERFRDAARERVRAIGCSEYLELVRSQAACDTNDTLSALAQPWFGVVMTAPASRAALVRAMVDELLGSGMSEVTVITNVLVGGVVAPASGTMAVERMMSAPPAGMESGHEFEVCRLRVDCQRRPVQRGRPVEVL